MIERRFRNLPEFVSFTGFKAASMAFEIIQDDEVGAQYLVENKNDRELQIKFQHSILTNCYCMVDFLLLCTANHTDEDKYLLRDAIKIARGIAIHVADIFLGTGGHHEEIRGLILDTSLSAKELLADFPQAFRVVREDPFPIMDMDLPEVPFHSISWIMNFEDNQ